MKYSGTVISVSRVRRLATLGLLSLLPAKDVLTSKHAGNRKKHYHTMKLEQFMHIENNAPLTFTYWVVKVLTENLLSVFFFVERLHVQKHSW
jgi:hypothetical protein